MTVMGLPSAINFLIETAIFFYTFPEYQQSIIRCSKSSVHYVYLSESDGPNLSSLLPV